MRKYEEDIAHIHTMMERSSRFISLSGISGVFAGLIGLAAAVVAYSFMANNGMDYFNGDRSIHPDKLMRQLTLTGCLALIAALAGACYFTIRKSRKNQLVVWNQLTRRLLINLFTPLLAGGIFCVVLLYHEQFTFVAPAMLIFYGISLINAGKFTFPDIIYLGYGELILGILALVLMGYGLVFWAIGFGLLHIIYGFMVQKKYH